jgi:signal transduction histidine kinase
MSDLIQSLWDRMRADLRVDAIPQLNQACQALLGGSLGPLTSLQTEDMESVERSLSKLTGRIEGEAIDWTDYSVAAHALRGPLNATIGFSRLMLKGIDGPINKAQREALETTYIGSRRLLSLFNLLLDALLLLQSEIVVDLELTGVEELLKEITIAGGSLADRYDFAFTVDVDETAVKALVRIDGKRIKQALSSLLAILAKYGTSGAVTLHAGLEGSQVLIKLESGKCRLPEALLADLPSLLSEQADPSLPYEAQLRLGLARGLLAQMSGELAARRTDETCAVTVSLPVVSSGAS